ncbi:YuzF family protein [Clostridium sp. D2Q-11]|uniref:YuzF family protein n=1 Tax=Anaeromonas frigoriresistens TaxID=2683708 RepID=A0A942Z7K3_9FIRM|nr:YuzF family protein [Anaeromonas frigoriresistens]MBS4538792.1 YuzF family protein [Anaeromonas frigoriresistens]
MNRYEDDYRYDRYPSMQKPMQVSNVDPYVVAALMTLKGKKLVVETVRGSLHGRLLDIKPDHIVIGESSDDSRFFIRIAEIVHIMPDINNDCDPRYR